MVRTSLVSPDIEKGAEILKGFDASSLRVPVFLWASTDEHEDWRLVVAARKFDQLGVREAYGYIREILAPKGFDARNTPTIMILRTTDPFIKELRRIFGKTQSTEGMRLGGQLIGDRFIEDAYVYRIA